MTLCTLHSGTVHMYRTLCTRIRTMYLYTLYNGNVYMYSYTVYTVYNDTMYTYSDTVYISSYAVCMHVCVHMYNEIVYTV